MIDPLNANKNITLKINYRTFHKNGKFEGSMSENFIEPMRELLADWSNEIPVSYHLLNQSEMV